MKRKIQCNSRGKEKKENLTKAKLSAEDEPKPIDHKRWICRNEFKVTFYKYGEVEHMFYECSKAGDRITTIVNEVENLHSQPEKGESLLG